MWKNITRYMRIHTVRLLRHVALFGKCKQDLLFRRLGNCTLKVRRDMFAIVIVSHWLYVCAQNADTRLI